MTARVIAFATAAFLAAAPAFGATVKPLHRFNETGKSTQSGYALGNTPYAELLQASDGNFYGTTSAGGAGNCPDPYGSGRVIGCGTIFRMTPSGTVTALYAFPYDATSSTAPDGAYPTAGLIQGLDGYLYGVAQDGGIRGCNGSLGCGTVFRISTAGAFTLLHQFCNSSGGVCMGDEAGRPMNHLAQTSDGTLYGTAAEGGDFSQGAVFSVSTSGSVVTLHSFQDSAGDGDDPVGALLIGHDGKTLYGTTVFGGANNGGLVFSYRLGTYKILHSFDGTQSSTPGTASEPMGALIYGADGQLYGTTYNGGGGGTVYSLNIGGGGFAINAAFPSGTPATAVVLGSDGMMYGTVLAGDDGEDGSTFVYNPTTKIEKNLASFSTSTGAAPRGALIEGKDSYLYGTNSLYGGSDSRGVDGGTVYRIGPRIKQ